MIMEYNIIPILFAVLLGIVAVDLFVVSVALIIWFSARLIERYKEYRKENPRRKRK